MFRDIYKKDNSLSLRLGILSGGQLGRMLIQSCMNYDLQGWVMDKDEHAPCAHFCSKFIIGSSQSFDHVYHFGQKVDVLTIEVEDVNTDALERLEKEGLPVFPQPRIIRLIQDKGLQKIFYRDHGFPTPDFVLLDKGESIKDHSEFFPGVLKTRRSGYDGKGVKILKAPFEQDLTVEVPSVLEKKISFKKEIAVIVARNVNGECAVYPTVELVSDPDKHLLDVLIAPAEISLNSQAQAQEIALGLIKQLGLVGLLAVEMFVTSDDKILINEISPRPHNSGHHTIEANMTSQFDQHLRAIMGLPLGRTDMISPAVMVNILGEPGYSGAPVYEGLEKVLKIPGVYVHFYGKIKTLPFRKMGHVTILDKNIDNAKEKAQWVKKNLVVRA